MEKDSTLIEKAAEQFVPIERKFQTYNAPVSRAHTSGHPTATLDKCPALDQFTQIKERTFHELRRIKQSLLSRQSISDRMETILLTSATSGEGKTFIALSLALILSTEKDTPVILADLDLSNRGLTKLFWSQNNVGLVDIILDGKDPQHVLTKTNRNMLFFLPCGSQHHARQRSFSDVQLKNSVSSLASLYRHGMVIVDATASLTSSISTELAAHVDQIVFVVDAARTNKAHIRAGIELVGSPEKVGFVLNRVPSILQRLNKH